MIYGGLAERLLHQTKEAMPHLPKDQLDWVLFNPEQLKRLYDDMVLSSGAKILFNTTFCTAETDGNGTITGVVVAGKSGLQAFEAKVYIDCTGDGDLAANCGAKYEKGMTEYIVPARIEEKMYKMCQDAGLRAHKVLSARSFSRVDIILNEKMGPVVLEINTIPGFTETSLLPKAAKSAGISFEDLCLKILGSASW